MRSLRRTVYWKFGEPITLAFVSCVADTHPELVDDAPPPAPAAPPPKLKFERAGPQSSAMSAAQWHAIASRRRGR